MGYQPGQYGADGLFHVTNRNAHAWPEVWIDGAGWIPFEPTPAFKEPTLGLGTGGPSDVAPRATTTTGPASPSTTVRPTTPLSFGPGGGGNVRVQAPPPATSRHRAVRHAATVVALALGTLAAVALLALTGAAVALRLRTRRRKHDRDPRARVLGAWAEALDVLATAGVQPRPSATAMEFALRHAPARGAGDAGPPLIELARLQSAAMFAPEPPPASAATAAWQQVDAIRAAVRHAVARSTRWRRRLGGLW